MQKEFDEAVEKGGKVVAIKYGKDKYRYVCTLDGKRYVGDMKPKEKEK